MYHSYLTIRLLSVAHTLVQRSKTLVQRCKHACAAFQNACSALHARLFSVANPLVQRYESLVQRCWRLYSAPHLQPILACTCMSPPRHRVTTRDPLPPRRLACATLHLLQRTVLAAPKHTTSTEKQTTWSPWHTHLGKAQLKKIGLYVCMCVRTSPLHPTSTPASSFSAEKSSWTSSFTIGDTSSWAKWPNWGVGGMGGSP